MKWIVMPPMPASPEPCPISLLSRGAEIISQS
jgi:hypothetical protein